MIEIIPTTAAVSKKPMLKIVFENPDQRNRFSERAIELAKEIDAVKIDDKWNVLSKSNHGPVAQSGRA